MHEIEQLGYSDCIHLTSGGEGDVYTCEKQGVKYIVKAVHALQDEQIDMLKKVNTLRSEYFPQIIDIVKSEEKTFIIREYIEGMTLHDEIVKNGCFSYARAKEIIFDVCSALRALHTAKPQPIIYRDLKPENIIVMLDGKVKLVDLGTARCYKQESVHDTVLAGTKGYTAPEVMAGMQSDERSDIYSIGIVFYELLSGRTLQDPPYQIRPVAENNDYLPGYVDEIIAKATDIDQTKRYASIDEFVYELENIKDIKEKQQKKRRNSRLLAVLAVVIVLAAGAIFAAPLLRPAVSETILSLDFDSVEDAGWLEAYDQAKEVSAAKHVRDGVFQLDGQITLKQSLQPGRLVHIRAKAPDISRDGPMYFIDLNANGKMLRFCVGNNRPYVLSPQKEDGFIDIPLDDTAMLARSGKWMDLIIWMDQDTVRYIVSDPDDKNEIAYTGLTMDDGWQSERWTCSMAVDTEFWNGAFTAEELETDIGFIRVASGPIKAYLAENVPAYSARKDRVDDFLTASMPLASELKYIQGIPNE